MFSEVEDDRPGIKPERVRRALRSGRGVSLSRRRKLAFLSALGLVDFAVISLYQLGVIRSLPDLPGRLFDSNRVNASPKAYAFGVPDGTVGALAYAATLVLAGAGGTRETGRPVWVDHLLAATVAAGAAAGAHYLYDMAKNQKRACPYCITGAALHFGMLALVVPEVRDNLTLQTKRR